MSQVSQHTSNMHGGDRLAVGNMAALLGWKRCSVTRPYRLPSAVPGTANLWRNLTPAPGPPKQYHYGPC